MVTQYEGKEMHMGLFVNLGMWQGLDSSDLAHFAYIVAHYRIFLIVLNPNFSSIHSFCSEADYRTFILHICLIPFIADYRKISSPQTSYSEALQ